MKTLTVKREGTSTEFSYEIVWDGSYEHLAGCVENLKLPAKKACIVTDSTVSELYLEEVKNVLSPLFETVTAFVFPAGEASKNLDTVKDLYTHLIENHFERKDILFALGGGVVGDLTGYAAATYLRGIDFIQLPTACTGRFQRWRKNGRRFRPVQKYGRCIPSSTSCLYEYGNLKIPERRTVCLRYGRSPENRSDPR